MSDRSSERRTDERLRVLLVFSAHDIGGAERSLTRMARHASESIDYRMITLGGEGDWSVWARGFGADVEVFDVFGSGTLRLRAFASCISRCRAFRPHIVYLVGLRSAALLRLVRGLIPGVFVHAIRSAFPRGSQMRRKFALLEPMLRRLTDHYVANSQAGASDIREISGARVEDVTVIYNGVDEVKPITTAFASRAVRVTVVANITGQKGHMEFLPVIQAVHSRLPELQVWFVGRNDLGSVLHERICALGLERVVAELGYCKSPEAALYSSRVFALPTRDVEGSPTAIIEAMAIGLPVVAYDIGGISEIIVSGVNGVLIQPGADADFAAALVQLLTDEALNLRLGQEARKTIQAKFSLERCASQHTCLWQGLVAATPRSRA